MPLVIFPMKGIIDIVLLLNPLSGVRICNRFALPDIVYIGFFQLLTAIIVIADAGACDLIIFIGNLHLNRAILIIPDGSTVQFSILIWKLRFDISVCPVSLVYFGAGCENTC